jgi:lipoate-protein ligase A
MPSASCLVLPYEESDGPLNMARDEALLEHVSAMSATPFILRTYGWTEPTLSLGYFQSAADLGSNPRWRSVAIVRRPTGGGAICHDREITYALAVRRDSPLARRSQDLYRAVHSELARLLASVGLNVRLRGECESGSEPTPRPFLCFCERSRHDVVVGGTKLVGSAQRRRQGSILQHGSLLLARSPLAEELPGVADVATSPRLEGVDWAGLISAALPKALGLAATPGPWPVALGRRIDQIAREVYRNPAWTFRR